mmetsp:Transcript_136/g.187  ORF Transcript_136/g.187 Transcript_136/m.187 type:complete len:262 (-) Transcript_136:267-1052(-)
MTSKIISIQLLLFLLHEFLLQQCSAQLPPENEFGKSKQCPQFQCTNGYEPVPKWPMRLTSSGCSGIGSGMMGISMNNMGDMGERAFGHCCQELHACYQLCGTSRFYCDESFTKCAQTECKINSDEAGCLKEISTLKLFISFVDCRKFDKNQRDSCECVEKKKVKQKRASVLRAFYMKYNPENVDKVEGLIEKATDTKKFAGLMMKLIAKYPKSVEPVEDEQKKKMDEMMKNMKMDDFESEGNIVKEDNKPEEDDSDEKEEL